MPNELEADIEAYAAMMKQVAQYDDSLQLSNLLVWRDGIHEEMLSGTPVSPGHQAILSDADNRLLALREELLCRFPDVFRYRAPLAYWWWHLDKGPQVREAGRDAA